jgi:hypothetical protein
VLVEQVKVKTRVGLQEVMMEELLYHVPKPIMVLHGLLLVLYQQHNKLAVAQEDKPMDFLLVGETRGNCRL